MRIHLRARAVHRGLALLLPLLAATPARAAGYYVSDVGTRGMARGGAFVASPDDLLALHYNPAGLSLLKGPHVEVSVTNDMYKFQFDRACPCVDTGHSEAAAFDQALGTRYSDRPAISDTNQNIPFAAVGYGFPVLDLTVALGVWAPVSFGRLRYGDPSKLSEATLAPQRYSIIDVELYEAFYSLGVALSPIENLRIGFVAMLFHFDTTQSVHLWTNSDLLATEPEDSTLDVPTIVSFGNGLQANWGAGVSYDLVPGWLSLGASVLGMRSIRGDGTAAIKIPERLRGVVTVTGDQLEGEVVLPGMLRAGAQLRIPEIARVEAAVVGEGWGTHTRVRLRPKDILVKIEGQDPAPLGTIDVDRDFEDAISFRLGGELDLFEPLFAIRAGYFYEPSAVPADLLTAATPDLDKHGLSLGLATTIYGARLELAGQYVLMPNLEVTDSRAKLIGALPTGSDALLTSLGNGKYSASHFLVAGSISVSMDNLLGAL